MRKAISGLMAALTIATTLLAANMSGGVMRHSSPATGGIDTVAVSAADVELSGYDKPLRAWRESVLVTNNSATDTLLALEMEITYTDMGNRMLHRRTLWVDADIPPGQTRKASFKSWDPQMTYYYSLGPAPRTSGVTPYAVTITPLRAVIPSETHYMPSQPNTYKGRPTIATMTKINDITPAQYAQIEAEHPGYIKIDVRQPEEYATGHIPGAILIPWNGNSEEFVSAYRKTVPAGSDSHVLLNCRSGRRSMAAAEGL